MFLGQHLSVAVASTDLQNLKVKIVHKTCYWVLVVTETCKWRNQVWQLNNSSQFMSVDRCLKLLRFLFWLFRSSTKINRRHHWHHHWIWLCAICHSLDLKLGRWKPKNFLKENVSRKILQSVYTDCFLLSLLDERLIQWYSVYQIESFTL